MAHCGAKGRGGEVGAGCAFAAPATARQTRTAVAAAHFQRMIVSDEMKSLRGRQRG
jgi:hypothetical protein